MTNIITITMDDEIIKNLDKIRESSNISRSKLIRSILTNFCNDNELIKKVLKEIE